MSHDTATQRHRDAVKDTAFRSTGLPLLRLRAEEQHTQQSLGMTLQRHLQDVQDGQADLGLSGVMWCRP